MEVDTDARRSRVDRAERKTCRDEAVADNSHDNSLERLPVLNTPADEHCVNDANERACTRVFL